MWFEVLQKMLDYAHHQGFDPTGFCEIGTVAGSRRWIGSVDVCALLRSFRVPATVVDFEEKTRQGESHDALFKWVWKYFQQRSQARSSKNPYFAPPLYFQHQVTFHTLNRPSNFSLKLFDVLEENCGWFVSILRGTVEQSLGLSKIRNLRSIVY